MRRMLRVVFVVFVTGGLFPVGRFATRVALAESTRTASEAAVLAEPSASAAYVSLVPAGTDVVVVGPPVGEFYPVSVGTVSGWMWGGSLSVDKDATSDPAPVPDGVPPAVGGIAAPAPMGWETEPSADGSTAAPQEVAPGQSAEAPAPAPAPAPAAAAPPAELAPTPTPLPDQTEAPAVAETSAAAPADVAPTVDATATTAEPPTTAATGPAPGTDPSLAAASPAAADPLASASADPEIAPPPTDSIAAPPQDAVAPSPTAVSATEPTASEPILAVPTAVADAAPATPTTTPVPAPEPGPAPGPAGPATVSTDANLRGEPADWSWVVFLVPAGSTVEQTGQRQNGYVSATYMWMNGWIAEGVLQAPVALAAEAPTATPPPELEVRTPRTGSGVAFTTVELSLRQGPSANELALMTVPAGARVVMTGVMENGFHRVTYQDNVGWLASDYLSTPPDPDAGAAGAGGTTGAGLGIGGGGANGNGNGNGNGSDSGDGDYSREEITRIIYAAADRYGQSRQDMLRVATCESNLDPYAVNQSGSYGLFQFIRSTWKSTPFGDKSMFDPIANSNAAGWMWQQGRKSEWVCK